MKTSFIAVAFGSLLLISVPVTAQTKQGQQIESIPQDMHMAGVKIGEENRPPEAPTRKDFQVVISSSDNAYSFVAVGDIYHPFYYTFIRQADAAILTPSKFEEFRLAFYAGKKLVQVKLDKHWGVADLQGKLSIPCIYDSMEILGVHSLFRTPEEKDQLFFIVCKDHKFGVLDADNKVVIPLKYDHLERGLFPENPEVVIGRKGNLEGLIDVNTHAVIGQFNDWHIRATVDGGTQIEKNHRYNLLAPNGTPVFNQWYDQIKGFFGNDYIVRLGDKAGIIKSNGNVLVPLECEAIVPSAGGLCMVKKDGKYGMFFGLGDAKTDCRYDSLSYLMGIMVKNEVATRWGVLSVGGNVLYPAVYDNITVFGARYILLQKNGYVGLIDGQGKSVLPIEYDSLQMIRDRLLIVKNKGLYGVVDIQSHEPLLQSIYTSIKFYHDELTAVDEAGMHTYTIQPAAQGYKLVIKK